MILLTLESLQRFNEIFKMAASIGLFEVNFFWIAITFLFNIQIGLGMWLVL